MEHLLEFITHLGWLAVVAVIYAESGLLIGFFLPGDSLLFTAGFLVQQGFFPINIHLFVLILFIAAVLGDSTGYAFGNRVGRKLFQREKSRLFHTKNLERAEAFYEKYGGKTIILARFVPVIRTFAPIVAGISKMSYRRFLAFNIIGALLWTASFTYLGYFAGDLLHKAGVNVEVAALIIIAISLAPAIYHVLKDKEQRNAMWAATKREVHSLFSRKPKR